jgi:adenosylcobinamide-phosphate synthase
MSIALLIALALAFDYLLGEPRRYHPLVGFGSLVDAIERRMNGPQATSMDGVLGWCMAVLPLVLLVYVIDASLQTSSFLYLLWSVGILYLAIGWHSLIAHAAAVTAPLMRGDIDSARLAVARIVSRDTATLDEAGIARGAIESVLENGADAIFAALFWFALLGAPGVLAYRLINTLDAMWGYKNERYLHFGWMAARFDDLVNFVPAQLTALTYALLGSHRAQAFACWRAQGLSWKSPNAGPVMAAGAGAINVSVGGNETYHGKEQPRSVLGPELDDSTRPSAVSLEKSCRLVNRSIALWIIMIALFEFIAR